jgi:sigma-E factor negative regulatory protein RseB
METMRIIHRVGENGEQQRLISLTGSAREVIRDNESVTCIFPDDRAVMVDKSLGQKPIFQLPQPIESVSSFYHFNTDGEERVAGRQSWVVNILPADQYRYGYKLWIDQDSYLLLKSQLRDTDNEVLEQILFTQLDIHEHIPAAMLEPALTGKDYTVYKNDQTGRPDAMEHDSRS